MNTKKNWYNQIEKPVRGLVELLRNHGFNTVCSCGHEKNIQMEWYMHQDIERLYNLLTENAYRDFEIHAYWTSDGISKFLEIRLLATD